jgi:hypothetical protein
MLIGNMLIILTGILVSITFYFKFGEDSKNKILLEEEDFPSIETGLIYAQVQDFVDKYEKEKGKLFVVGVEIKDKILPLERITFNKLTDEINLDFGSTLKISLTGVSTIAVGDKQFLIHGFETASIDYDQQYELDWRHNKLLLLSGKNEPKQVKIPSQMPTIVFDWS